MSTETAITEVILILDTLFFHTQYSILITLYCYKMYLEIITPDKKVFEGEVESATFPGTKGSFQVLANHAPLISTLANGSVTYVQKAGGAQQVQVQGGVVEVLNNKIIVLAESVVA